MIETPLIDPTWTVQETMRHIPAAAEVFDIYGIDVRERADLSVDLAARLSGAELDGLLECVAEAGRVAAVVNEVRRVVAALG